MLQNAGSGIGHQDNVGHATLSGAALQLAIMNAYERSHSSQQQGKPQSKASERSGGTAGPPAPTTQEHATRLAEALQAMQLAYAERIADIAVLVGDFEEQEAKWKAEYAALKGRFQEVHAKRKAFYARCKVLEEENRDLRLRLATSEHPPQIQQPNRISARLAHTIIHGKDGDVLLEASLANAMRHTEERVKRHLSYQLGNEMVRCGSSFFSWVWLPARLIKVYRTYRRLRHSPDHKDLRKVAAEQQHGERM